ncbi:MAG TPA: PAS domain-containing protein [Blastocatellia bacterium]|nr:PAS domain-containing protein [Blastocatellia bacterium]
MQNDPDSEGQVDPIAPDKDNLLRARSILNGSPNIIFSCNAEGRFTFINKAAERITGYSSSELLKMNISQIVVPDQAETVQQILSSANTEISNHVIDVVSRDHQRFRLEFKLWRANIFDSEPETHGIARDFAELRIEAELEETKRRYRSLAANCHSLICTHDLDGVLLSVNETAAKALGYTAEEMVGRNLIDFLAPYVKIRFHDYLSSVIANREYAGLLRAMTRDGEELVWFCYNILCEESGKEPFILGHAQDVTSLVKTDEERDLLIGKLQRALQRVKSLTGILPICSSCKSIRDDRGDWTKIEKFFSENSDVEFSHAICPDCTRRLYPNIYDEMYP